MQPQYLDKKQSPKLFDTIAPTYDAINRILSFGRDQKWRKTLANHLPSQKNLKILDLATGTADQILAFFANPKLSLQKIIGLDLSTEMLDIAKKKVSEKPYKDKIQFLKASAEEIPLQNNTFDAVSLSFGIRNMPNPKIALKEIHRVLKQNGKCLILEFSLPPKPIQPFYLFYLRKILPRIGAFLSKSSIAYQYLNETIESFPSGDAFAHLLKQSGFCKVQILPMALGAVSLYIGEKD